MTKLGDLSINVGIEISEETVQRCCQLLQIYLTDHPDKFVASQVCNGLTFVSIHSREFLDWCPICDRAVNKEDSK